MAARNPFNGKNIVLTLVVLLVYLVYSYLSTHDPKTIASLNQFIQPSPTITIQPTKPQQSVAGIATDKQLAQVSKVVDGDTIDVLLDGKKEKIRIIGLNTPETVDPRRGVQCFGKEASNQAKQTLTGKTVYLESDPSQTERDKYGRLLRFVFLEDSKTDFAKQMIQEGYGYEYTYDLPYKYQTEYKAAQEFAKNNKKGLWADNVCPQ